MTYFVLVILTDGEVFKQQEAMDSIVAALNWPLSVVVMGIGDAKDKEFAFLRGLQDKLKRIRAERPDVQEAAAVEEAKVKPKVNSAEFVSRREKPKEEEAGGPQVPVLPRDVVYFEAFDEEQDHPAMIAASALSQLPREVVGYFTRKRVWPRDLLKHEDKAGNPIPKKTPTEPAVFQDEMPSPSRASSRLQSSKLGPRMASTLSNASRGSKGSRASSTLTTPAERGEKEMRKRLEQMPAFFAQERERLLKEAEEMG